MSNHDLTFKVLRLRPADLAKSDQSHFSNVPSTASFRDHPLEVDTEDNEERIEAKDKSQLGLSGAENFGTVYLGQALTIAIALCNQSKAEVNNVGIRVEIQSDHGKAVLYDTMPTQGMPALAPGATHEFVVKHDIRDLGPHTFLCASAYVTPAFPNEPKYSPQSFKFNVLNPIAVRTKHRALGSSTVFLEAIIENKTEDTMLLESVDLAVAAGYSSHSITNRSTLVDPLEDSSKATNHTTSPLLHPGGGATGYIFKLTRLWQQPPPGTSSNTSPRVSSSPHIAAAGVQDGSALGKLDIKWKGPLGDPARLQTQTISGTPRPHRELRLEIVKLPDRIAVFKPFTIEVCVVSGVDRRLGPLKVSYHQNSALKFKMSAPIGSGNGSTMIAVEDSDGSEEGIVLDGLQSECIQEVPPRGSAHITLSMLPRLPGRQYLQGLILTDERDGRVFDTLTPIEVCVEE